MPLFAEVESGGWRDFLIVAGPIVSGVAVWALTEWRKGRAQARADRRDDVAFIAGEYDKILERRKREEADAAADHARQIEQLERSHREESERRDRQHRECLEREAALARRVGALELKYGRVEVYVERLEEIADDWSAMTGKPFRKWRDTPLMAPPGPHPPPGPKKDGGSAAPPDGDSDPEAGL